MPAQGPIQGDPNSPKAVDAIVLMSSTTLVCFARRLSIVSPITWRSLVRRLLHRKPFDMRCRGRRAPTNLQGNKALVNPLMIEVQKRMAEVRGANAAQQTFEAAQSIGRSQAPELPSIEILEQRTAGLGDPSGDACSSCRVGAEFDAVCVGCADRCFAGRRAGFAI
jgi:hypothetical protein